MLLSHDVNGLLELYDADLYGHSGALVTDEKREVKVPAQVLEKLGFLLASRALSKLYSVEIKFDLLTPNSHNISGHIVQLKSVEITNLI